MSRHEEDLPRAEWDFGKVPDENLPWCRRWEFYREAIDSNEALQEVVASIRNSSNFDEGARFFEKGPNAGPPVDWILEMLCLFTPEEWPKQSFQSISKDRLKEWSEWKLRVDPTRYDHDTRELEEMRHPSLANYQLPLGKVFAEEGSNRWQSWPLGKIRQEGWMISDPSERVEDPRSVLKYSGPREPFKTIVALNIDFTLPNKELTAQFAAWLKTVRDLKLVESAQKNTGKGRHARSNEPTLKTIQRELTGLGVLRLSKHYGSNEAARSAANRIAKRNPALYAELADFSRSKLLAEKLLRDLNALWPERSF